MCFSRASAFSFDKALGEKKLCTKCFGLHCVATNGNVLSFSSVPVIIALQHVVFFSILLETSVQNVLASLALGRQLLFCY
jgi:hypothetical protein